MTAGPREIDRPDLRTLPDHALPLCAGRRGSFYCSHRGPQRILPGTGAATAITAAGTRKRAIIGPSYPNSPNLREDSFPEHRPEVLRRFLSDPPGPTFRAYRSGAGVAAVPVCS